MTEETMIAEIARTLGIQPSQVQSALSLFAQGNTLPFIARYRKEATGSLDEVQLRCIQEQYDYEQALASRKETVRQSSSTRAAGTTNWQRNWKLPGSSRT